uniref:Uncharacterized protein n=1 Tax=Octopus bimaculoides TaxID=37653 RepID=A0A0L8FQT1_OCTBM
MSLFEQINSCIRMATSLDLKMAIKFFHDSYFETEENFRWRCHSMTTAPEMKLAKE